MAPVKLVGFLRDRRFRFGSLASCGRISVRTSIHAPSFGEGCSPRSYLNSVWWPRTTLRTVARYRQRPHDLVDRATLLKIGASNLADLLHANHSPKPFPAQQGQRKNADTTRQEGSELDAKIPLGGDTIVRDLALIRADSNSGSFATVISHGR